MLIFREPWRTRLLFLSLAGNVFALALIGAHVAGRRQFGPPGPDAAIDRMARDLAPADGERFRAVMAAARPQHALARGRMEAARDAMSRAIGQAPYDEAAVRQAMLAWQSAWLEWSRGFGATMLTALADLSPDGRRQLAEAGQRRKPR